MSALPRVSGREVVAALSRAGFAKDRQRGSHVVVRQVAPPHRRITVPDHDEIATGTLRAIIRQADRVMKITLVFQGPAPGDRALCS